VIRRPLPFAVLRSVSSSRRRGRRWKRQPLNRVLVFRPESALPSLLRRLLSATAGIVLFTLAPMPALAQVVDSVVVSWTSAGDDDRIGVATAYDMRISASPINESNFESATPVNDVPAPAASGTRQRLTVRGLTRGTVYFFAIKSVDDAGNRSDISNVLRWDWIIDTAPPAVPGGLAVTHANEQVRVTWAAGSEPDLAGYRVYRAVDAEGPFTLLNASLLSATEYVDASIPDGATAVWYRVSAVDGAGNESAKSAVRTVTLGSDIVAEATLEAAYPNPARGDAPTTIPIVMPETATAAVVDVVTSGGVRVRRIDVPPSSGRQEVVWDGRNDAGRLVAPGAYRAWLIAGDTRTSIRLLRVP
jgi:hypothetical protein